MDDSLLLGTASDVPSFCISWITDGQLIWTVGPVDETILRKLLEQVKIAKSGDFSFIWAIPWKSKPHHEKKQLTKTCVKCEVCIPLGLIQLSTFLFNCISLAIYEVHHRHFKMCIWRSFKIRVKVGYGNL